MLDSIDLQLLAELQSDARTPTAELGRQVGLSGPGVQKRLRKLEEAGIICGYRVELNRAALGLDLLSFVQVTLARHRAASVRSFKQAIRELPEVLEAHHLTGESDYLLKVAVRDQADLERFLVEVLSEVEGVDRVRTSIALSELKPSARLPLDRVPGEALCAEPAERDAKSKGRKAAGRGAKPLAAGR